MVPAIEIYTIWSKQNQQQCVLYDIEDKVNELEETINRHHLISIGFICVMAVGNCLIMTGFMYFC
jgi:hypothetical protein